MTKDKLYRIWNDSVSILIARNIGQSCLHIYETLFWMHISRLRVCIQENASTYSKNVCSFNSKYGKSVIISI